MLGVPFLIDFSALQPRLLYFPSWLLGATIVIHLFGDYYESRTSNNIEASSNEDII